MGTQQNTETYRLLYEKEAGFLRYPADWVLRFKNMFLRERLPHGASILDFGCGSANNSIPFIKDGHKVFGVDVSEAVLPLVAKNLEFHGVPIDLLNNFAVQNPPLTKLGFSDNTFDFILSNQVHYYSRNVDELHTLNQELLRVLKPNGIFFATMMGPRNYYITHHTKEVRENGDVFRIEISDPTHRLYGVTEEILITRDGEQLLDHFREFEVITTGYFDQGMFDMHSNHHFIFCGFGRK